MLLCFAGAEFHPRWRLINDDERNTLYRYDPELGWMWIHTYLPARDIGLSRAINGRQKPSVST